MNWTAIFREVVSGRRQGILSSTVRGALRLAELPYTLVVQWRNRRYDRQTNLVRRVSAPVISVGNLTLGGTGKTPMVKWIVRWFEVRRIRPAIVSRGYRAAKNGPNDEALELNAALPDVPHIQDRDRVAAATVAIEAQAAQVVVADDAFQHRRLGRDLDIVLVDALEPFGFDHVFPRGALREPVEALRRAELVCLTRADMVDRAQRRTIEARVRSVHPEALWCEVAHQPGELLSASGNRQPLTALAGRPVLAFCGIGNPAGFRHTLDGIGYRVVVWKEFPDHHAYTSVDLRKLGGWAAECRASAAICTQKDLVKLGVDHIAGLELWAVSVEMQILAGREHLEAALERIAAKVGDSRLQETPADNVVLNHNRNPQNAPSG
jgi:tetraacyldisaccharide 4'-kinase